MFSKLFGALALVCLLVGATAMPTQVKTASRQSGFTFAVETLGPSAGTNKRPQREPKPAKDEVVASPPPEPAVSAPDTPPEVLPIIEEPETTPEAGFAFAYNVGGMATGEFMDDPEDWVVGETAIFEIPNAEIEGAPEEYADIYKSHRYGLVGSTWGYDIAVDTPGLYDCTLHYSEIYSEFFSEEPNRTFKVAISGDGSSKVQRAEFDVMVELEGAEFTPYTRTFKRIRVLTTLKIRETPSIGDAFLSGISCTLRRPISVV